IVIPPAIFFYYSTLFDSRFKTLQQNQWWCLLMIMDKYGNLVMLYANHIIEGNRSMETVPALLQEDVKFLVNDALKKELASE
ncbi:hypothetical protein, partial [Enterococcus xiangfangensis]|uniref:hypothetical protein n=1 Tax=Enterococcus xiangfangensis TaxID=1296537 RepID=UPI003D165131|nr:hypothetical protein [Enterococcus asini]